MNLVEKLKEVTGSDEMAESVRKAIGEYMIPKTEYAKLRESLTERDNELETIKTASMTEQDKLKHELEKATALQTEFGIKSNRLDAKAAFISANIAEEDYNDLLDKVVSSDKDKTLSMVNSFVSILSKTRTESASKKEAELMDKNKKPDGNDPLNTKPTTPPITSF